VRVLPTPNTALADTVLLVLRRKGGPVIASQTLALAGDLPKGATTTFDLTSIKDADGIPLAIRGDYQVDAYPTADADTATAPMATAAIRIALITAEEMRKGYCFGTPLYASDMPMPKRQPQVVTGVTITRLSEDTRKGTYALSYDATAGTLSWGGGAAIPIGSDSELLPDQYGGYAEAQIDEFELPDNDAAEGIIVDKEGISDDFIRAEIDKAIADAENATLKVFLEPVKIATEPYFSEGGHDRKMPPVMFTRRDFNINGLAWRLDLPVHQLRKVDLLEGFLGNTRTLQIQSGALSAQAKSGEVHVLPYDSEYSLLYTFFVQMRFWGIREYIADFWRYTGVAGLMDSDGLTPADVLKLVGYGAAITILTVGGQGYRGGFSSESISKDGVSVSKSYTASATYGIYSASINEFKEWIKTNTTRLRNQYRGLPMVVL
jgi:hypothetical protein